MASKSKVIWTLRELTTLLRQRQMNEFDVNMGVSGKRGNGKSTFLFKLFNSFNKEGFNQEKHQVYRQKDVINLLSTQRMGFCWDDEAINSGYKRDFQQTGQKELIKIVTNFRDNYNVYASALPFFYSLDKDLRELIFMHIHIIERGLAVIFIQLDGQIHSQDPWDTKNNTKIEQQENDRMKKDTKHKFRYHRFTTFAGYLYFGDMTAKQKKKYLEIKRRKRGENFGIDSNHIQEIPLKEKLYNLLIDGKLSKEGMMQICLANDKKYSSMSSELNRLLKDKGEVRTVREFFTTIASKPFNNKKRGGLSDLVPTLSS